MRKIKLLLQKIKTKIANVVDKIKTKFNSWKSEKPPTEFISVDNIDDPHARDLAIRLNQQYAAMPLELQRIFIPAKFC